MKKSFGIACVAAILLSGCATEFLKLQESSIKDKDSTAKEAQAKNEQILDRAKGQRSSAVSLSDKSYLGVKAVPVATQPKPPAFLSKRVELVHDAGSILEFVDPLSAIAKVPVVVREDALQMASRSANPAGTPRPASTPSAPTAPSNPSSSAVDVAQGPVSVSFVGTLSSLLDLVASRFGLSWRYLPEGSIEFFYRDTKTFMVMVLPGDVAVQSEVGTAGGTTTGVGSSRNATQKTSAQVNVQFWKELLDSLNAVKSRDGVVTVSASTGTVTVTDTPSVLARVEKLIDAQNALLTKQVLLDIKVVNVKLTNREQLSIDWELVYRTATKNVFGAQSAAGDLFLSNNGTFGQIVKATPDTNNFAFIMPGGTSKKFSGSAALLNALAEQSQIGAITSAQQYALNNQATPIQVGRNARFIESSTYTPPTGLESRGTVTYQTNTISSGVALQLLPRILDNQNLLIHFSVDISDEPENLKTDISDASQGFVSLYAQNVRNFMQRVSLRSGETLVLSGYEKHTNKADKNGAVTPDNLLFGGKRDAQSNRDIIVIMITPIIMDRVRS